MDSNSNKEVSYYKTYWEKMDKLPANATFTIKLDADGKIDLTSV